MRAGPSARVRARRQLAVALVLALLLVLAGVLALARDGGGPEATGPATTPTPTPAPSRSPLLPAPGDAPVPTRDGLGAALGAVLGDPALGGAVTASVVDATTGAVLLDQAADTAVLPASTNKIATAVGVLAVLPPDTRLTTRALAGPLPGDVVLVGGGDVTLAGPQGTPAPGGARLGDLADQVRGALAGAPLGRVLVDDTAWTGPALGPSWRPGYVTSGNVAPVQALSVDAGRTAPGAPSRVADPALQAGRVFAGLLGAAAAPVLRGVAAPGAAVLGSVASAPVTDLVERMLTRSDNDLAEALAHRLAMAKGLPASFDGGAAAVRGVVDPIVGAGGVVPVDGSGLSRDDRVRPAAMTALLSHVVRDPDGRFGPVLSGLPVAGFDGTLEQRYRTGPAVPAAGQVRAKTGTLEGVSALAGLVRTADGRLLAFDVTLNAVRSGATRSAEAALDRVAASLAACGCR